MRQHACLRDECTIIATQQRRIATQQLDLTRISMFIIIIIMRTRSYDIRI